MLPHPLAVGLGRWIPRRPGYSSVVDVGLSELLLAACMFFAAALYTSVGHAGASAYLALMALFDVEPTVMRPTALVLNVLVSSLTSYRFVRAGLFRWRTLWPILIGAVPMSFIGGSIELPGQYYRSLVALALFVAAVRLIIPTQPKTSSEPRDVPIGWGVAAGAGIGLLAGLTGTGGGVFLSPLLLLLNWSETRTASGVAAVFILCNSTAGLLGNLSSVRSLPPELPMFAGGGHPRGARRNDARHQPPDHANSPQGPGGCPRHRRAEADRCILSLAPTR